MALTSFRDALTPDARLLWDSPAERRSALQAIVETADPVAKREAVERVDGAVLEALEALGLPRGPIRGLKLWPEFTWWNGRKHPDCTLSLSEIQLADAVRINNVDNFFSSWVHESLHARQPYGNTLQEYREWPGYEEGLVEALTQRILIAGGMSGIRPSFPYYVTAYEIFSTATEVDLDVLLRVLWTRPAGHVRQVYATTMNGLRAQNGRPGLDRLQLAGDLAFRIGRANNVPDRGSMTALIMRVLR
jgi:hypothetical protein